ncbi:MAG: DUF2911 domain-containing protein [Thermoanaerobaculia bacterium]
MRCSKSSLFLVLIVAVMLGVVPSLAQRGDDADRASKNGRTEGSIEGVGVTLEYGRPNVKSRAIWGGLVPYDQVWRTGANEATTITISQNVVVEGKELTAGTYGLFTIPGESEWIVIFNKVPNQWGAMKYDEAEDALRVTVEPTEAEFVEAMEFEIDGSEVVLRWESLAVPVTITAAN